MKKLFKFLLVILIFIYSCSESVNKQASNEHLKNKKEVKKTQIVKANRLLVAEISGMVCEMGCGGSIRKEMINSKAVEQCKFDFVTDRKSNRVEIAFDKDKISADKLIALLSKINDKQFKVIEFTTKDYASKVETNTNDLNTKETSNSDVAKIKVETPSFNSFNLLSLLSHLITA